MSDVDYTTVSLEIDCSVREARQLRAALLEAKASVGTGLGDLLIAITAIALHNDTNPPLEGPDAVTALYDAIPPEAWDQWLPIEAYYLNQGVPASVAAAASVPEPGDE